MTAYHTPGIRVLNIAFITSFIIQRMHRTDQPSPRVENVCVCQVVVTHKYYFIFPNTIRDRKMYKFTVHVLQYLNIFF